jgi:hypothetical protein
VSLRKVLYRNQRHSFTISDDEGRLVMEVLCGGPGMYTEEHWLTDEETAIFLANPEALVSLALTLCS